MRGMDTRVRMKMRVKPVIVDSENICREYALPGRSPGGKPANTDRSREREQMKEALLPFVREAVKKQMKEEREYYRSRPSLAARQLESFLGQGQLVSTLTGQVCEQMEQRFRHERLRRGR